MTVLGSVSMGGADHHVSGAVAPFLVSSGVADIPLRNASVALTTAQGMAVNRDSLSGGMNSSVSEDVVSSEVSGQIAFYVAAALEQLVAAGRSVASATETDILASPFARFHSSYCPPVPLRDYLPRIVAAASVSEAVPILVLIYLDRLIRRRPHAPACYQCHGDGCDGPCYVCSGSGLSMKVPGDDNAAAARYASLSYISGSACLGGLCDGMCGSCANGGGNGGGLVLTALNVHRLVAALVLVAAKWQDDLFYNNAYFARLGGVSLAELNRLESTVLALLDYRLAVTPGEYEQYREQLLAAAAMGELDRPVSVAPTEVTSITSSDSYGVSGQTADFIAAATAAAMYSEQSAAAAAATVSFFGSSAPLTVPSASTCLNDSWNWPSSGVTSTSSSTTNSIDMSCGDVLGGSFPHLVSSGDVNFFTSFGSSDANPSNNSLGQAALSGNAMFYQQNLMNVSDMGYAGMTGMSSMCSNNINSESNPVHKLEELFPTSCGSNMDMFYAPAMNTRLCAFCSGIGCNGCGGNFGLLGYSNVPSAVQPPMPPCDFFGPSNVYGGRLHCY